MKGRLILLADFGTWAVGLKVMEQSPGADLILGRHEMAVKVVSGIQAAVERVKLAVEPMAGAIGCRIVKGQEKAVGVGAQFEDRIERRASDVGVCPSLKVSDLLQEVGGLGGMINVPHALLNGLESIFEPLGPCADGQESVPKAKDRWDGWEQ